MVAEDLRELGGEGAAADQHGAVPGEPSPTARGRQLAGDHPARDDEADGRRSVDEEGGDRLLLVAQGDHGRHDGDGGEQPADRAPEARRARSGAAAPGTGRPR